MIKFCSCTGRSSSSSFRNLNKTGILMTCKGCTGELTSDRGGSSCSKKLNSMGLDLPRPIDLEVTWKNVNRRQRAARRPRTSFFGEDRTKDELRSFYAFGNAMNQDMSQEDAPASDPEKLGVSILGRRFSDPMGSVPIKKRRFHVDCSPSPPPTPLLVGPHEKSMRSSGGNQSYEKRYKVKMLEDECKEEHTGLFHVDDFSGISILAAAACESEMDADMLNGTCSKLAHSPEERKLENIMSGTESSVLHGTKGDMSNVAEASHCTYDKPFDSSNSAPDMKPLFATAPVSSENINELASTSKVNCSLYSALSADKTEIISDNKSSSVAMASNSSNPDKSAGCSQDATVQNKCANAARDSRLHWDLNVAMEAWDTDCGGDDDDTHGGPAVATVSDRNNAENGVNTPLQPHDHDSVHGGDAPDFSVDQIHMVDVQKDVNTMNECDFPTSSSSHPLQHQSSQNFELLKSESVRKDTSAETLDLHDQQKSSFASAVESHLGSNPEPTLITQHIPLTANVEKTDGSRPTPIGKGLSHMSSADGDAGDDSIQKSELGSTVKTLVSRLVSEESTTNIPSVTALRKISSNVGWSDNKLEEASEQSISELKNQDLLDDSGTSKLHQIVSKKDEHGTDVLKSTIGTENLTHPENIQRSSVCDVAYVHEEDGADAMTNSKDCLITCTSSSSAEAYHVPRAVQVPALSSECDKPVITDAGSIAYSQTASRSFQNIYKNELGKVASDTCVDHCHETAASHYSNAVADIGKVDVEEDDSQYEDGEVRESGDWANDAYEVKCANWHYLTSDYNNEAITSDMPPLPIHSHSKTLTMSCYSGTHTGKEYDTVSPLLSKRSWSTNCLDGGSGASGKFHGTNSRVAAETQMHEINPGCVAVGSAVTVSQSEKCNDGLDDDLSSIRTKNTGWDMFPEDQGHYRRDLKDRADSSNRCVLSSSEAGGGDDSFRKMGLLNRDVQQIERPRPFDRPHINELSRSDDSSGTKAERAVDSHRTSGVYDVSCRSQAGSRGEQWVENSEHHHSTRCKSPECYNYGPAGPRNAAEAAVAKMESSGFVVARDGTLVRAVDAANAGQAARRIRNTLSNLYHPLSGRGSLDRDGTCGLSRGPANAREASSERHFVANSNRSFRYGPGMGKDHTSNGNLGSVHCSLSSRHRGMPTGRASVNLSRARSRSPKSRSRSPHDWALPRDRRKIMTNGGSTLHRSSRSPPNRMAKVRMGRMTSPQSQHGYNDRALRYNPPSRNHNFSHASTWIDGRNNSTLDHSDKRYSRRSPIRVTSRNGGFDVVESPGRSRSGEFYRPTQRFPYGYDRANKYDGNVDDEREHAGRYQTQSVKPNDRNGSLKQFRNNNGEKFRSRISAPRSPEPQRRASPRRFER